jgi:DNA polymerase III subunit epsilon
MLHQLLNLTRPLIILDAETTGTDPEADRMIEIGFQQWTAEGMIKEWRSFIDPLISIPAETTAVHGIADEFIKKACRHCQRTHDGNEDHPHQFLPSFKQLAASFARGFTNCDFGGQNVRFDLRLLSKEFARSGMEWSYDGARIVDSYALESVLYPRDLSTLHEKYAGRKHDGAHGALSDVRASTTVLVKQLEGHAQIPRDLDALHALLWPGWLTMDGSFKVVNGVATIAFGKHKGKAMKSVPLDYYDFILKNNFPGDVKRLAQRAKLGEFPQ